jgi:hypothetical protein
MLIDDSLEGKMAVDPLKNKRCWIKAQILLKELLLVQQE